jgi:DNA (cytosine-5)-methyltransferase 1
MLTIRETVAPYLNHTTAPSADLRLIDLFCGAGGMSQGFRELGFKSVWANDFDEAAAATYRANFGEHCRSGDLVEILEHEPDSIPPADVVIGGPPCQGFSLLNKDRVGDPRRQLWRPYLEVVRLSGAEAFVMENVPQLIGTPEHDQILATAEDMGFSLVSAKLLAADYGVPQTRLRAFIVGCKCADPGRHFPPLRSHYDPRKGVTNLFSYEIDSEPWRTVRDAIGDLEAPVGTEIRDCTPPYNLHFGRSPSPTSQARYRAIPEEGMNREDLLRNAPELTPRCWLDKKGGTDLFGRLWWDRPAFTIRTEFFKPEKGRYLHPSQHRPITHREAARFQSFPDDFVFVGSKIQIAKQIGNAVPPRLARAVAASVRVMLTAQARTR